MIIFVCRFRKIHAGHGPWKILFNSHVLIRISMSASEAGERPYLFSGFSNIVNEFHRQLWDSSVRQADSVLVRLRPS